MSASDQERQQPVPNAWHYGPTATDPDPGKRWHYGCGGEVMWLKPGGDICDCGQQWDDKTGEPVPGTGREPATVESERPWRIVIDMGSGGSREMRQELLDAVQGAVNYWYAGAEVRMEQVDGQAAVEEPVACARAVRAPIRRGTARRLGLGACTGTAS